MLDQLMGALGYVGDSLDKLGGREIRGALGGKPRELLSFVPFSDRLGITDEKDITSGRDLLHNAGLVRKDTKGIGAGLAGWGAEAALDPSSLFTGGLIKALRHGGALGAMAGGLEHHLGSLLGGKKLARGADAMGLAHPPRGSKLGFAFGNPRNMDIAAAGGWDLGTTLSGMEATGHGDELIRALQEFHPDSKHLGSGAEALVHTQPGGYVTRVSGGNTLGGTPGFRPNLPDFVLQPLRSNFYGDATPAKGYGLLAEHLPKVNPFVTGEDDANEMIRLLRNSGNPGPAQAIYDSHKEMRRGSLALSRHLSREAEAATGGLYTGVASQGGDLAHNPTNLSWFRDPRGNMRVISHDAGAIYPRFIQSDWGQDPDLPARLQSMLSVPMAGARPEGDAAQALMQAGAPGKLQEALAWAAQQPIVGQGMEIRGDMLGHADRAIAAKAKVDELMKQWSHLMPLRDPSPNYSWAPSGGGDDIMAALGAGSHGLAF